MKKTDKIILSVVAIVVIAGLIYLGIFRSNEAATIEPIRIGISASLTGDAASIGEAAVGGAELAVKEINDNGGINGRIIELIIEDDQCSSEGANAFSKLVNFDDIVAIAGPICSSAAGPGIPIAQEAGIPVIMVASAPSLIRVGDYIFRNYPSDALQGNFAAEYIFNDLSKKKVAVIYVKNAWGEGIRNVFVKKFKELGGEVVFDEGIIPETRDLRSSIFKLKIESPEVVYLPVYPSNGIVAFKQFEEMGIDVPIIGGDTFAVEEVYRAKEAEGVLFTQSKTSSPDDFYQQVKTITGKEANVYTPFVYDAVKIIAQVIDRVGTDKQAIKNELNKIVYKDSIAVPVVEFDSNGDLKSAEFEIVEIKNGKPEVVEK